MSTPNPFVIDNFNRANATTLGTSSSGVAWTAQTAANQPAINANTWYNAGNSAAATIPNPNEGFAVVEATVWGSEAVPSGNTNGLIMLKTDGVAGLVNRYSASLTNTAFAIVVNDGSGAVVIASSADYRLSDIPQTIRLQHNGERLRAWVGDVMVFDLAESRLGTITHLGAYTNRVAAVSGSWVRLDNFTTYDAPFIDAPTTFRPRRQRMAALGGF